jgi:hypothetical protein
MVSAILKYGKCCERALSSRVSMLQDDAEHMSFEPIPKRSIQYASCQLGILKSKVQFMIADVMHWYLNNILFSDEATFHTSQLENSFAITSMFKAMGCAILSDHIIGPLFFTEDMDTYEVYLNMLENFVFL